MIHLEETPWWICDKDDFNFCAYVDTDSNYFNAEPLLKYIWEDIIKTRAKIFKIVESKARNFTQADLVNLQNYITQLEDGNNQLKETNGMQNEELNTQKEKLQEKENELNFELITFLL